MHHPVRTVAVVFVSLVAIATVGFKFLEGWTWIDAFYFSVATASTVGYGDFVPSTELSRFLATIYIILSVSTFFVGVSMLSARFVAQNQSAK